VTRFDALLGEVTGGGRYEDMLPHSIEAEAFGVKFRCVSLPKVKLVPYPARRGEPRE
jgi:hypothetical protein